MKHITIIYLFFAIMSCNLSPKQGLGCVNNRHDLGKIVKDTIITYYLEGISSEGVSSEVNYVNDKISQSITHVYGETGQSKIIYEFEIDKIRVLETKYSYKSGVENVKSDDDMQLDYEISYLIDFKGNFIGKKIPERIDIFKEFKEIVPFEL